MLTIKHHYRILEHLTGLEPAQNTLQVCRSTIEPQVHILVGKVGLEPTTAVEHLIYSQG